ncbi:MAG: RNA-binding S4 domain-containing protein [Clostridiales bacterium]|nr:RNA-binding S4 domain-containing protein [Clostridiales bacterium]
MRIDKYLKVSRLIKRRTVANEACDREKVFVNGRVVKASYEVKIGDEIELRLEKNPLRVVVTSISAYVTKEGAKEMYEIR